ncbi:MAG TPA: FG-GAP-like repeat-containing protein [Ignavibacteria bacterium]|nr:FG-GAP-like repeat-containing protein [Ignavibacteria bacterium]HMR38870.1 FG-GAP-like repeat-containing protein [Ignavibacteria bacterium]
MKKFIFPLIVFSILITVLLFIQNKKLKTDLAASGDSVLYMDVSAVNLPVSAVSGPGMDVGAADFDGDGDPDIVIAREFAPNKLLLNQGNGVFTDGTTGRLPQFNYDSEDIGIADFDRDGDLDLVFASEDNAVHEFYLNDGHGVFTNFNNRLPNSITNGLLVIDLNNDNYPDLIFGNSGPGNPATETEARVLINNQDTTFRDETALRFPAGLLMVPQDIKAGDIDNDGDQDLIFGNETGNRILINNGSGIFTDETIQRLPLPGNEETRKVTLEDIDNDGDLDMFFANVQFRPGMNPQNRLLINNDSGYFTDETSARLPLDNEHTTEGVFIDIDFDNDPDLITSNVFVNRPVKVFLNNGKGIFEERTSSIFPPGVVAEGLGIITDDLNMDGLKDIYVVHRRSAQSLGSDRLLIRKDTATVGIGSVNLSLPENPELYQNYPNPFNPVTEVGFGISDPGFVTLKVYDMPGNELVTLLNEPRPAGSYKIKFDGKNFSSGIYFYSLSVDGKPVGTKRMVLIK